MVLGLVLSLAGWVSAAGPGAVHGWGKYNITGRPAGLADAISVKAAANYTYVLRSDHTIALWGENANAQLDAPAGLSNVVQIAAGYYLAMALTDDGNVHVWGGWGHVYRDAMLHVPASVTNVLAIAAGMEHCLALRADGTVVAWGCNLSGQTNVPPGLSNVVQIAAGQAYSVALTAAGQTVVWGDRTFYGTVPAEATNLVAVAPNLFGHVLALRRDGTVLSWGNASAKQLNVPAGLSNVVAIADGDQHSVALKSDGSLVAWGDNTYEQGVVSSSIVVAKAVAAGSQHNVVISDAPLVEEVSSDQWWVPAGTNVVFQAFVAASQPWDALWFKDGVPLPQQTNLTLSLRNVQVANAGDYSFVASNACGATSSQSLRLAVYGAPPLWNQPPQNQVVLPGQSASFFADVMGSEPFWFQWAHNGVVIPGATNALLQIAPVSAADEGAYTVTVTNNYGRLVSAPCYLAATVPLLLSQPTDLRVRTNWSTALTVAALSPLPLEYRWFKDGLELAGATGPTLSFPAVQPSDAGDYVVEVSNANGAVHTQPAHLILLSEQITPAEPGVVVEWGSAPYYQPALETNVVGLAVGMKHTLALCQDGSLRVWGDPSDLSLQAIPPEATNVADVFTSPSSCVVLRKDNSVVVWGINFGLSLSTPGNSNVAGVAGGPHNLLLLKRDGSVAEFPSATVPPNVTNIIALAQTEEYAVALQGNGKVLTWTAGQSLACEMPGLDNVTAVAGGETYTAVALRADGTVAQFFSSTGNPSSWTTVAGVSNAVAVAGGRGFMALLNTGEVRSWYTDSGAPAPAGLRANRIAFNVTHQAALTPAPFFDTQPVSQTFYAGQALALTTAVRSATPLTLQWYFEGAPIPGATNQVLQFASARPSQSGHYKLVARNANYTTESQTAVVSVEGFADILQVSADQSLVAGQALQLQVQYVANPPATVQWRFNGLAIPNATNNTLLLPQAAEWMSGSYTLSLSNAYGIITSPAIQVLVASAPPTIVTQPSAPAQLPDGAPLRLQVGVIGSAPLAYQWFFNDAPLAGQTQALLQLAAISLADNGTYQVQVTNALGSALSDPVTVTSVRAAPAPDILSRFLVVREGKPIQLQALARGTSGARYQWRLNQVELPGETNAVLLIPAATLAHAGAYSVAAVNDWGSGESAPAQVRVLRNPGAGLLKAWGMVKGQPDTVLVEAVGIGRGHGLVLLPEGTVQNWGDNSYWQAAIPAGLSNAVAIAAGQDFNLALRSDGTVVGWGRNDAKQATPPSDLKDAVAVAGGVSHALALRSDGSVVAWGSPSYTRVPTNLPPIASIAAGPTYSLAVASNGTVWAWGAPNIGSGNLTNVPSSVTNAVAVAAGGYSAYALGRSGLLSTWPSSPGWPASATNLTAIAANGLYALALRADVRVFAWGTDYYGQVRGAQSASNVLAIAAGDTTAVVISGEPRIFSTQVYRWEPRGSSVVLTANAAGTGLLSYQWSRNKQLLAGATAASLVIDGLDSTNTGSYSLEVKNAFGSASATIVSLFLGVPPTITTQPADQTVTVGSNATFLVQCSGTATFAYQWALNGTNLLGATGSSLTLSNLLFQDQGSVSVQISNAFGSALSQQARLRVVPPPSRLSLAGSNGALNLRVAGYPNRSYTLLGSSNLLDWLPLQTFTTAGTNLNLALPLGPEPARFYRLLDVTP
jgi:alpha-tubulin suppressor-like RCC1 family protein